MAKQQPKKKAPARRTPAKKHAPGRTGTTGTSGTSARKAAAKKPAAKKAVGKRAQRTAPTRSTAPSRAMERARPGSTSTPPWPDAVDAGNDVQVHPGIDQRGADPRAQLHAVHGSPNESHPGSTRRTGPSHDRPGSQLERKRHQYPSSNVPNKGSAHTTQAKGRRRNPPPPSE